MSIRVLSPDVVSKIAAGEVVERPASVVKELVENSLDAGATQVNVDVRGGGVGLVRVSDNGVGISEEEVDLAFERYATSKITSLADLQKSTSLGFRGEALHSIAAVAQVELISATAENPAGIYVRLQNGLVVERDVRACSTGTIIVVRNIFQTVPARLKFLKSQATESGHIADLVTRMCLAFPSVQFTLAVDGKLALRTSGNGRLRDALIDVYGLEVAQAMVEVGVSGGEVSPIVLSNTPLTEPVVSGYVSPPAVSRSDRSYLSFFVNRRWVSSRLMTSAVEKAYQGRLMVGRHPIVVLNVLIPPQDIDVNVHPGKREIKFSQDQIVFTALHKSTCRALETQSPVPEASIYRGSISSSDSIQGSWLMDPSDTSTSPAQQAPHPISPVPILRVLGQMAATYVIAEGPDGLYLIDQHAAHERILFEKVLAQQSNNEIEIQGLLEPITIELNPKQWKALEIRKDFLASFGFGIEDFGERTFLIRAVPAVIRAGEVAQVITEVLDDSVHNSALADRERKMALSIACHSAIKAGQTLSLEELRGLVAQLEHSNSPRTCPHGRPTMIHLSAMQLAREFGRS